MSITKIVCVLLSTAFVPGLAAQSKPPESQRACDLANNADVEKATGRHLKEPPGHLNTTRNVESACDFWDAAIQLALFPRTLSQDYVTHAMAANGFAQPKHAVAGVGDSASIYFAASGKTPEGWLVVFARGSTILVRVKADTGKTAESVQRPAVELAKVAVSRLR